MPLPPIPLDDFRAWATRKWTDATQAVIDALPVDNWALDAGRQIQDTFGQAQQWLTPPAPPSPPPEPPPLEPIGPPSPNAGQRLQMEAQNALGGLGAGLTQGVQGVGDWAAQAQQQIGQLGSGLGSAAASAFEGAAPVAAAAGAGADTASRYLPGNIGPAAVEDLLGGTPYRLREGLQESPVGAWLGDREEETRTQQRIEDERMARMALGEFPGSGGRPAGVGPDDWEREVQRARWLRETGQNLAGGSGLRFPSANQLMEVAGSAPLTSVPSLLKNLTSGGARTAERLLVRAFSGHPLEALNEARVIAGELRPGSGLYSRAGKAFMSGPTPRNPGAVGPSYAADSLYASSEPAAVALTGGVRANAATDEAVRSANEAAARATGLRRGYAGQQLDDFVREAGDYATVTGTNSPLATALNKAKQWARDPSKSAAERGLGLIAEAFAPYVGMPERLLIASTRAVVDPVYAPTEYAIRRFLGKNPMAYEELQGRFLLGLTADLALWQAAGRGALYGRPPRDPQRRAAMERAGAHWDSFVGPGGVIIPLSYLGTFGQAAGLIADAQQAQAEAMAAGKPANEQVSALLSRAMSRTLDESYVADFGDFLEKVGNDQGLEAVADLAAGQLGRFPALVAGPINASDPYARDTRGPGGALARVVPGGRYALPAKIDPATGEPVRRQGSGLGRYLSLNTGEETSALRRELSERGVGVRDFRDGKYTGVAQTPAQLEAIRRAYGSEVGREARAVVASREYQDARPLDQAKLLQQALSRAYAEADVRLGDAVTRSPKAQADFEYRAVPQYEGVKGTPDEIRRQNAQIAEAKRQLTAARAKYPGDPDKGERELLQRSRATVRLAERARLAADDLRRKRTAIYAKHGLNAQGQDEAALDEAAGGEGA